VSSVVLIDVLPVAIGIGLRGGKFQPVIPTNTSLPAKASVDVFNNETDERATEVHLFQGEDEKVARNDFVGTVEIRAVPPGKKGQVKMALTLRLGAECQLSVEARDASARELRTALHLNYSATEMRRRLHLTQEETEDAKEARAAELRERGGGFWSLLKRAVGRA
jgi:molecular chaperone DnaK (HSP70)